MSVIQKVKRQLHDLGIDKETIVFAMIFGAMVCSVRFPYITQWISSRLPLGLRPYVQPIVDVSFLSYLLMLVIGSSIIGILADLRQKCCEYLVLVGGVGTATVLVISDYLGTLTVNQLVMTWIASGSFHATLLMGAGCFLKERINVYQRGISVALGLIIGASLGVASYSFLRVSSAATFLQVALLLTAIALTYLVKRTRHEIIDAIHVRDFRMYFFTLPIFVFSMFLGMLFKVVIMPGLLPALLKAETYVVFIFPYFVALIAGRIADTIGRREVGIVGYIFLGLSSLSLYAHTLIGKITSITIMVDLLLAELGYSFIIPYGIAVWTDLPKRKYFGRIFSLGIISAVAGLMTGVLMIAISHTNIIPLSIVVTIMFVISYVIYKLPETLPRELLYKKELRDYLKKAKKIVNK